MNAASLLGRLPGPSGERFVVAFAHGTLSVELYAPRGIDPQQPHTRDEAYVVLSGSGTFVHGDARSPFAPGDFLFVPAGVVHRFEDFSDDFAAWVLFYGPEGGERPGSETTAVLSPGTFLSEGRSTLAFEHGTLTVKLYAPRGVDPQQPHTRDEAYVVVAGRGLFEHATDGRNAFEAGDFLFAPAGLAHRFADFGDDFAVWVVFYGPEGGEGYSTLSA